MRKKVWLAVVLGVVFAGGIVACLAVDFAPRPVHARTAAFHVVIDAGHGGRDGGAVGRNGTREADINLSIARYLEKELLAHGVGVTMTRKDANSLANPYAKNQKKSDMEARRKIIESVKPDLVLSIHLNVLVGNPNARGLQAFTAKYINKDVVPTEGEMTSKMYADKIQDTFNKSCLYTNRKAATGDYFILQCTPYPSVLLECGFLSNATDEKLLRNPEYQKILAQIITKAVVE